MVTRWRGFTHFKVFQSYVYCDDYFLIKFQCKLNLDELFPRVQISQGSLETFPYTYKTIVLKPKSVMTSTERVSIPKKGCDDRQCPLWMCTWMLNTSAHKSCPVASCVEGTELKLLTSSVSLGMGYVIFVNASFLLISSSSYLVVQGFLATCINTETLSTYWAKLCQNEDMVFLTAIVLYALQRQGCSLSLQIERMRLGVIRRPVFSSSQSREFTCQCDCKPCSLCYSGMHIS